MRLLMHPIYHKKGGDSCSFPFYPPKKETEHNASIQSKSRSRSIVPSGSGPACQPNPPTGPHSTANTT